MQERVFRRKIYDEMLRWKTGNGTSALLIEGARRVGKTTIVQEFARNEYWSCLVIDFMNPLPGTIDLFEAYRHNIGLLMSNLSILYGVQLRSRESLIVFDEVQKYPRARELIKYLVQDGRYDYIETGSLISIKDNVKDIQIPSEEESVQMVPMDFEEWLWANGEDQTMDMIREHFDRNEPLGQQMHKIILDKFRLYMIVGGMPGAVSAYLKNMEITDSEKVKHQIIDLYRNDMHKIGSDKNRALAAFNSLPAMLSSRRKLFKATTVEPGSTTDDFSGTLEWLFESKITLRCISNTDPNIAMNLYNDPKKVKAYLLDTGILITLSFDVGVTDPSVLVQLAKSKLSVNEGMLFENIVAQELTSSGCPLYFHEFYTDGDDKHPYEVDFILVKSGKIVPIEVKSSISTRHASLDKFVEKYRKRISGSVVIHSKDLRIDGDIRYIPVYMTSLLGESMRTSR